MKRDCLKMPVILSVSEGSFPEGLRNPPKKTLRQFVPQDDKTINVLRQPLSILYTQNRTVLHGPVQERKEITLRRLY